MNRIFKAVSVGLMLGVAAPVALTVSIAPAFAQADAGIATAQDFHDALTAAMKSGGTAKSRYAKLKPAIDKDFDIAGMTAVVVGSSWASMSEADKKALTEAFGRVMTAEYARNFDSYDGQKFTSEPVAQGANHFVRTTMTPKSGDTIKFLYQMVNTGGQWRIARVYASTPTEKKIDRLPEYHDQYASTLASAGPQGLAKKMNALVDQMMN